MHWTFDIEASAFYFYVADHRVASQRALAPGVVLDLGEQGEPVGIEWLVGSRDAMSALSELTSLLGETTVMWILHAITNPPLPDGGAGVPSAPVTRFEAVPTGERTFDLSPV